MCWNSLFQQSTKLNVAHRHVIHPQAPNLQRKHTPVNILNYNRISITLQQNQKKVQKDKSKMEEKNEGIEMACYTLLIMAGTYQEQRGERGCICKSLPHPSICVQPQTILILWRDNRVTLE